MSSFCFAINQTVIWHSPHCTRQKTFPMHHPWWRAKALTEARTRAFTEETSARKQSVVRKRRLPSLHPLLLQACQSFQRNMQWWLERKNLQDDQYVCLRSCFRLDSSNSSISSFLTNRIAANAQTGRNWNDVKPPSFCSSPVMTASNSPWEEKTGLRSLSQRKWSQHRLRHCHDRERQRETGTEGWGFTNARVWGFRVLAKSRTETLKTFASFSRAREYCGLLLLQFAAIRSRPSISCTTENIVLQGSQLLHQVQCERCVSRRLKEGEREHDDGQALGEACKARTAAGAEHPELQGPVFVSISFPSFFSSSSSWLLFFSCSVLPQWQKS